ncbi:MAG: hypothetical protein WCE44_14365 [Candidatus Velthaea sp.]|jgi:hypothetical protein
MMRLGRGRIVRSAIALTLSALIFATVVPQRTLIQRFAASAAELVSPAPAASPTLPPTVKFGELKGLKATATGTLSASITAPLEGGASDSLATALDVLTVEGATLHVEINGEAVDDSHLGQMTTDTAAHTARFVYYGVPLNPGPNRVVVTPLGAGNAAGPAATRTVYGPGRPVTFEQHLRAPLVADGRTAATLEVTALDAWGHHAQPGSVVKVQIIAGDVHFAAAAAPAKSPDPAASSAPSPSPSAGAVAAISPSLDLAMPSGGILTISLVPGLSAGQVSIHISSGEAASDGTYYAVADVRKPFVNGLITAGAGSVPDAPEDAAGIPNGPNSRKGRIALYGTGAVGKNGLLTVAYDTADRLDRSSSTGPSVDDPASRPYGTYGDSSIVRDDALSRDHLYARFDDGQSHALWGEFQATTSGPNSVGGFAQLVDGLQVTFANQDRRLTGFVARNDVAYGRLVLSPSGLSTLAQPLQPDIVVGSEIVSLIAIDRRTGIILSQTPLTRNVDYELDYTSGQIRFITIPLPFDDNLNPQQILVTYEYGGPGVHAQTVGGRFDSTLGRGPSAAKFGAGYVNDGNGTSDYSLFTQELSGTFSRGSWSLAHATSAGNIDDPAIANAGGKGGNAYKGSFTRTAGADKINLSFEDTSSGFANPFGGLSSPGLFDYRGSYAHSFKTAQLELSFDHQLNDYEGSRNAQSDASLKLRKAIGKRLSLTAGISYLSTSSGTALIPVAGETPDPLATPVPVDAARTLQAQVGADWKVGRVLSLSASHSQNLGASSVASSPAETVAQATLDFGASGRAYVRELFSAAPTESFAASTANAAAASSATHLTTIGFERALGHATTIDHELQIDQGAAGTTLQAVTGVKERFVFGKHLRGDVSVQDASGSAQSGFATYAGSLAYTPSSRLKISTSLEDRTGQGAGMTLFASALGAINDDLSVYGDISRSNGAGIASSDDRVGLAWRPSQSERGVTLFGYRETSGLSALGGRAGVLSIQQLYRPTGRLELVGSYAYKLDGDSYFAAKTGLFGLRATQKIGANYDLGAEFSSVTSANVPSAEAHGLAIEAGHRLTGSLRVAVGYNVRAIADPSLSNAPSRKGFYITMTSVVDRILGWGAQH